MSETRERMGPSAAGIGPVIGELGRVRDRARRLLLVRGVGLVVGGVLLAAAVAAGLDFFLRTPGWFRMALWVVGVGAAGWGVWTLLVPAWRFRPSLTEVALRVERSETGRRVGLGGVLASGLELGIEARARTAQEEWLASEAVRQAQAKFAGGGRQAAASLLQRGPALRGAAVLAAGVLVAAGAWAAWPQLAGIGAARVLAPWSGAQWPKRTGVVDVTGAEVHPLGTALPLRAAVTRTNKGEGRTEVTARYRLVSEAGRGPVRRAILNAQGRTVPAGEGDGELYERLVEPAALASAGQAAAGELEYWFETEDDRTETRRVKLVAPPAVSGARAEVTPPAYVDPSGGAGAGFVAGRLDLGPGNDARALVGPVIAGSRVEVTVEVNKPVPGPGEDAAAWLGAVLPGVDVAGALGEDVRASMEGSALRVAWTARESVRLPVVLTDEFGIQSVDEAAYTFEVVTDREPTATVTRPAEDESVLPTAVVDVAGEGRDDVGLASVALEQRRARPPVGSMGAPAEPAEEPVVIRAVETAGSPAQAVVSATVDLAPLGLKPGDELWLTALAADVYSIGEERHEPARSQVRKLRVIGEDQLVEQLRGELAGVRRAAMRMDEEQGELAEAAQDGEVSSDDRRRQAGIAQRLEQQEQMVAGLQGRVERNRLRDPALQGLLDDVRALMGEAERAAAEASAAMDAAAGAEDEGGETPERAELSPEQAERARGAQERVRDRLGQVIQMLDRGEDGWLARRSLQRLVEQQRALQQQTAAMGEQTLGREANELSPQERAQLQQIAERQQELADQANKALDELSERSEQLKEADPAQAAAMREAAQRGREQQVPQTLEQASQNVAQNQTATAQQQQQQAIEAMEQMLDDLDRAERNRDEALRRILASLIESLDGLIAQQERELAALEAAAGELAGLDAGMIKLNQNTLGVLQQAREAGREAAEVADLIDRAGRAQTAAIVALRDEPGDAEAAGAGERESLRLLKLAREEAQRQEDEARQRDQARQRAELRKVYREVLEQQVALRAETAPLAGQEIGRRERAQVRGLGERQETLRSRLADLRKQTEELAETEVFDYAHGRLDMTTGAAGKRLRAGAVDGSVVRDQDSAIRILQGLVEALSEDSPQDEFREQEEGGGGGGGGGSGGEQPLIPPLAELRLLRAMQQEAADRTRDLDDAADVTAEEVDAVGQLQRDLAEHGETLIRKMQGGPMPPNPGGE